MKVGSVTVESEKWVRIEWPSGFPRTLEEVAHDAGCRSGTRAKPLSFAWKNTKITERSASFERIG
jgi:hypothetical protein